MSDVIEIKSKLQIFQQSRKYWRLGPKIQSWKAAPQHNCFGRCFSKEFTAFMVQTQSFIQLYSWNHQFMQLIIDNWGDSVIQLTWKKGHYSANIQKIVQHWHKNIEILMKDNSEFTGEEPNVMVRSNRWWKTTACSSSKEWNSLEKDKVKDRSKEGKRWSGTGQVANSHLQGTGKGDSGGAEATRSSDLGLMEVVVGGIGRGGGGGCSYHWRSSTWCCCRGAGSVFSQLSVRTALLRLYWGLV